MTNLRKLFDNARAASEYRAFIRGILGHPDGTTISVAARTGYVYARLSQQGGESVVIARNNNAVAARYNLPVRMRLEPGVGYVITGVDHATYNAATSGDTSNDYNVVFHTHRIGAGLEYELEALRLEPGRCYPSAAWTVTINPFRYFAIDAWQTYEGEEVDLLANRPSTAGKHRWVVIAVDPATNTATKTNGSDQNYATTLTQADLDAIDIGDDIPLVAVRIRADDTALTIDRFIDAGAWRSFGVTFLDSDGDPANVTTGTLAPGNSNYASRADHLHGITDAAVTFGKIQDVTSDRLIGRDTAGSGSVEELSVGGGLEFTGSAGVQRSALTGDVTATAGSGTTTIANDAVSNAKLANMTEATVKGRAAGAGTGDPTDLTAVQAMAIVGGVLYVDNVGAGNVGTGEDTLATYTVAANQLTTRATLWFEAQGTLGVNGNSKRLRVYFGGTTIFDYTTTTSGGYFLLRGRVVAVGGAAERTSVELVATALHELQYINHSDDLTGTNALTVTGEATSDDDIDARTLVVGWTVAP